MDSGRKHKSLGHGYSVTSLPSQARISNSLAWNLGVFVLRTLPSSQASFLTCHPDRFLAVLDRPPQPLSSSWAPWPLSPSWRRPSFLFLSPLCRRARSLQVAEKELQWGIPVNPFRTCHGVSWLMKRDGLIALTVRLWAGRCVLCTTHLLPQPRLLPRRERAGQRPGQGEAAPEPPLPRCSLAPRSGDLGSVLQHLLPRPGKR